jgi:2-hydroxy-6-oxonona-2,4-dienedioate hydrolase
MSYEIKQDGKFKFIEEGRRGNPDAAAWFIWSALSNFKDLIEHFRKNTPGGGSYASFAGNGPAAYFRWRLAEIPVHKLHVEHRRYTGIHLMGNSLGGHVALVHILKHPQIASNHLF